MQSIIKLSAKINLIKLIHSIYIKQFPDWSQLDYPFWVFFYWQCLKLQKGEEIESEKPEQYIHIKTGSESITCTVNNKHK